MKVSASIELIMHLAGQKAMAAEFEEIEPKHLLEAVPEIRPLSRTDPERAAAMTEWMERHTKPAPAARSSVTRSIGAGISRNRCPGGSR